MIPQSLKSMLGVCQNAEALVSGCLPVEQRMQRSEADLLIAAKDVIGRAQERPIELTSREMIPFLEMEGLALVKGRG